MPPGAKSLTIIVPVYNGEVDLARTLRAVIPQLNKTVRLSVVLNGCRDQSYGLAQSFAGSIEETGADFHLLDLRTASRGGALNAGEKLAVGHRLYLDQDAVLSPNALREFSAALDAGYHFVAANAHWRSSSRVVRAAMRAWNCTPYVRSQVVTAGAYAVSEQGRARWADWPLDLPDDKYARLNFSRLERIRISTSSYEVSAPDTFSGLVKARRRYRRSNSALRKAQPALDANDGPRLTSLWRTPPSHWIGLAVLGVAEVMAAAGQGR